MYFLCFLTSVVHHTALFFAFVGHANARLSTQVKYGNEDQRVDSATL